jgi:hypothetical protein
MAQHAKTIRRMIYESENKSQSRGVTKCPATTCQSFAWLTPNNEGALRSLSQYAKLFTRLESRLHFPLAS